jgi:thioredoxin reductase
MPQAHSPRIAVLGAGPIGLEAALYASQLSLPTVLYERGRVAEYVQRWGHVRLFTPFEMNVTSLGLAAIRAEDPEHEFPAGAACTTGREHIAAYLEPLAKTTPVRQSLKFDSRVVHIGRRQWLKEDEPGSDNRAAQPFRLTIRDSKGKDRIEECDVVLDCTGTYGQHRWAGDGGVPALGEEAAEPQIAYGLENILGDRRGHYAGKSVLVIGGGFSAATSVSNLASLAEDSLETWVTWLARCHGTQPVRRLPQDPLRERDRLAARANMLATRGDGNVEFHNQTAVEMIESLGPDRGFRVTVRCAGKPRNWEVDRVLANVGYSPDTRLYRELQIHECYATLGPMALAVALNKQAGADCTSLTLPGASVMRNPEPNFYVLGAKSYGRNSQFLLRMGFEQIQQVFALITGKPNLNLYTAAGAAKSRLA